MSDKPTNNDDEHEFSLNKFDLNDADHKQAPSVPELFHSESIESVQTDPVDDSAFAAPRVEQTGISAAPESVIDDDFPAMQEPDLQDSGNKKTLPLLIMVSIVIVALVAWFNLAGNGETDQTHQQGSQLEQYGNKQMPRTETQITLLQQRISSLQTDLISKNKQIAELTHLLSEQSRQPTAAPKKQSVPKKASVIQKRIQPIQASTTPIRQHGSAGSWAIIVASVNSQAAADKALATLKAKGIDADISPTIVKGKPWFRIRVSGFASRAEADIQKKYLTQQHGIKGAWIHKSK